MELAKSNARIIDNSNAVVFLSGTISILLSEWKDIWLYINKLYLN